MGSLPGRGARVERVPDEMAVGYVALAVDWSVVHVNAAAEFVLRRPRHELVGGVLWDLFPDTVGTVFEEQYRWARSTGKPVAFEAYYPEPLSAWYEIQAVPEPGGLALYFRDVTARHESEAVRELAVQRLAAVTGLALAMADVSSIEELVTLIVDHGLSALGCDGGSVAVLDPDGMTIRSYLTASDGHAAVVEYELLPITARLPVAETTRTGGMVLVRGRDECIAYSPQLAHVADVTGSLAFASLPLRVGPGELGVVTARWAQPQRSDADQLTLLETFASQCAQALRRLRDLSAERAAAARVAGMAEALQRSLMTELPEPDHLELAARYAPASDEAQVGGDWYDAFMVRDRSTLLVIGDVTGHLSPLVVDVDGRTELLDRPHDLLVGLRVESDRHDHTHQLPPGSTLLLYTDGLVKRRGQDLKVGLGLLEEAAGRLAHLPLQELCDALVSELATGAEDDVALLAVRAHPQDRPRPPEAGPQRLPGDLAARTPTGLDD